MNEVSSRTSVTLSDGIKLYLAGGGDISLLQTFVGVSANAVSTWRRAAVLVAKGYTRPKVVAFFAAMGITLNDKGFASKAMRDVACLFAFELLPQDELARRIGISPDGVDRLVRGSLKPNPERSACLAEVVKSLSVPIQKAMEELRARSGFKAQHTAGVGVSVPHVAPLRATSSTGHEAVIEAFAHLAEGMLPLAKLLTSNACSPAEREKVRQLSGTKTIFELSNHLNKLCGERMLRTDKQKGE